MCSLLTVALRITVNHTEKDCELHRMLYGKFMSLAVIIKLRAKCLIFLFDFNQI
jgi:hypothetical protein